PTYISFATASYSHPALDWYTWAIERPNHNQIFFKQAATRIWADYEARRVYRRSKWEQAFDKALGGVMYTYYKNQKDYFNFLIPTLHRRVRYFNPYLGNYNSLKYYSPTESSIVSGGIYLLLGYSDGLRTIRERAVDANLNYSTNTNVTLRSYDYKSAYQVFMGPSSPLLHGQQIGWLVTHHRRSRYRNLNFNRGQLGEFIFSYTDERHLLNKLEGLTAGNLPEPIFSQWRRGSLRGSVFDCSIAANTPPNSEAFVLTRFMLRFLSVFSFFKGYFFNFSTTPNTRLTAGFGNFSFAVTNNYASIALPLPYLFNFNSIDPIQTPRFNFSLQHLRNSTSDRFILVKGFNLSLFDLQAAIIPNYYYGKRPFRKNWKYFVTGIKRKSGQPYLYTFYPKRHIITYPEEIYPRSSSFISYIPSFLRFWSRPRRNEWAIVKHAPKRRVGALDAETGEIADFQSFLANRSNKNRDFYYRLWWGWAKEPRVSRVQHFFFRKIVRDSYFNAKIRKFYTNYSALHLPETVDRRFLLKFKDQVIRSHNSEEARERCRELKLVSFHPIKWDEYYYNVDKYSKIHPNVQFYRNLFTQHNPKWYRTGAHKNLSVNYTIYSRNFQVRNFLTESIFETLDHIPYGWDYNFIILCLHLERNLVHLINSIALIGIRANWLGNSFCAIESDWFLSISLFWIV
ncbi:MAG TPA: hypothetical protein VEA37_15055, partial [Flavobacterium sp.]|nr:hypothetical protein [Flavobacterium sp.]